MKYLFVLALILFAGCAGLQGLLTDTAEIAASGEANPEIHATFDYISDFVEDPWKGISAVGIGYALALLRRWYKRKMGCKTV